jgi:hypothetical protein
VLGRPRGEISGQLLATLLQVPVFLGDAEIHGVTPFGPVASSMG